MEENSNFDAKPSSDRTHQNTRESNLNTTQTSEFHECEGKVELCKSGSCTKCFHEEDCACTPCKMVLKSCGTYENYSFCSDHPDGLDGPAECGLCHQQRKIDYYRFYRRKFENKNYALNDEIELLKNQVRVFTHKYGDNEDYTDKWNFEFRKNMEFGMHTAIVNKVTQDYKERETKLREELVKEFEEFRKKEEANSKDNLMNALVQFTRQDSGTEIKTNKIGELTLDETFMQLLKTLKFQQERIDELESDFVEKFNDDRNKTIESQKQIHSEKTEYLQNEIHDLTEKYEEKVKTLKLEVENSKKVLVENRKLTSQNKKKKDKNSNNSSRVIASNSTVSK
jgi:hypothetical protein